MVLEAPSKKLAALPIGGAIVFKPLSAVEACWAHTQRLLQERLPYYCTRIKFLLFLELAKAGTRLVDLAPWECART